MSALDEYRIYRAVIKAVKQKRAEKFRKSYSFIRFDIKDSNVQVEFFGTGSVDIEADGVDVADKLVSWGLRRAIRRHYPEEYKKYFLKDQPKGLFDKPEKKVEDE